LLSPNGDGGSGANFFSSSRIGYVVKVLAAGIAFALLIHFSDTKALLAVLEKADYRFLVFGSLVFLYGQYLAAQRWRGVLKAGMVVISRFDAFRLNLLGTFVGNFLPGQGSGDLVKSAFLFGDFAGRKSFLLASVVYDRLLGLAAMLTLALAGVVLLGLIAGDWTLAAVLGWALFAMAVVAVALAGLHRLRALEKFFGDRLRRLFSGFSGELFGLLGNRALFMRSFFLSMIFQLSWALSLWLMLLAVTDGVPLIPVLLAAPLSVLVASVPISLGGLGIREGAFSVIMQGFGMGAEVATSGALLSLAPLLIASSLGAGFALKRRGRTF
jgi:glycosyltransferase 2 family protein